MLAPGAWLELINQQLMIIKKHNNLFGLYSYVYEKYLQQVPLDYLLPFIKILSNILIRALLRKRSNQETSEKIFMRVVRAGATLSSRFSLEVRYIYTQNGHRSWKLGDTVFPTSQECGAIASYLLIPLNIPWDFMEYSIVIDWCNASTIRATAAA